jgi:hypothetical protein
MSTLPGHAQLAYLPAASEERAKWVSNILPCANSLQILDRISPIDEQIYVNEPGTSTFLWALPVEGEKKMIFVFELYQI